MLVLIRVKTNSCNLAIDDHRSFVYAVTSKWNTGKTALLTIEAFLSVEASLSIGGNSPEVCCLVALPGAGSG